VALAAACSSHGTEGVAAKVELAPVPAKTSIKTALGYDVSVTRAWVALSSIEVTRCAGAELRRAPRRTPLGDLRDWWLGTAHAHETGSSTKLSVARGVMWMNANGAVPLGTLSPPAQAYCDTRVTFQPADEHFADADKQMLGRTFVITGTATRGADVYPFEWSGSLKLEVSLSARFELSEQSTNKTLIITREYGALFDGIEFATLSPSQGGDRFAQNLLQSLTLRVE
jgi:hypothetical protein